jgi:hypothetical protein
MTRSSSRTGGAAALAVWLALAGLACHGTLDFGGGAAGVGGAPGTGGAGGGAPPATCSSDGDCRLSVLHCDLTSSRTCVACTSDAHCAGTGSPRCDLAIHRCVVCLAATDCATGETCAAGHCVMTCREGTTPSTCVAPLSCDNGVCGACEEDAACGSGTPFCLGAAGMCVGCRTDADCAGASPHCDPVKRACVACASAADCPAAAPLCDPRSGVCTAG